MAAAPTKEEADVAEQDDSNAQSSVSDEKYRSSASSVGAAAKAECGEAVGGLRRDRFGCPITSKSKNHSLCFADEAPGANQEPLVCTVNVESFKEAHIQAHNRVNSEMHPEGDGRLRDTAVSSNDQVPPFSEEDDDAKRMRAKTHSICFADEVPGGEGELAHVRYVESFKEHNRAFNYVPDVPVASEFTNRRRRHFRAPQNVSRIMAMPYTSPSSRGRELSLELASSCAWNRM
ncbi:hypothetical protein FOZ60_011842 [Perkinsus olseni]|uniref:Uncharacterized protein n=1 Tax=Perkinsus olseni TaxID=32597 RepID=A0A7J6PM23_PEROL|nr:hypothetical protein FOZ60_011842 [Perkinsus olseni]